MEKIKSLLSFNKRIGRKTYWVTGISTVLASTLAWFLIWIVIFNEVALPNWIYLVLFSLVMFFSAFKLASIAIQRLHDLNLSGIYFLFLVLVSVPFYPLIKWAHSIEQSLVNIISEPLFVLFLGNPVNPISLILLGLKKGTIGANKYGADPLEKN